MMLAILRLAGIATGLISLVAPVYADQHTHDAHSAAPALEQGRKWATDEVLRRGMDGIRQAILANREAIEKEHLGVQDYQRLAAAVNKDAADIVKNCKLSKEVDSAFHSIVLADLMQSTELMQVSPKAQVQRAGAFGVLQSLRHYGEYFHHPAGISGNRDWRHRLRPTFVTLPGPLICWKFPSSRETHH
jgi:hypothetical protein